MATSFALPTLSQQKEPTPSDKDRQQLEAMIKKFDEAWNHNDAAALAALYAQDAVIVTDSGPIYGREAIEKHWSDVNVREGGTWKDQLETATITPAPAATSSPTATPSSQ
ncbi:MAG TPA: SgcJ/EcaC family oxidoreductase [Chthoniobacterales bacterium]